MRGAGWVTQEEGVGGRMLKLAEGWGLLGSFAIVNNHTPTSVSALLGDMEFVIEK